MTITRWNNRHTIMDDTSALDLERAVHRRARWVFTHVVSARERFRHVRTKAYVSGEEVLQLGRRYMLRVVVDAENISV